MKVIFLPYDEANPYQKLLKEALEKEGVYILPGRNVSFFPVLRSLTRFWEAKLVHFHWISPFLLGRSMAFSLAKSLLFIFELIVMKTFGIKIVWTIHNITHHEGYYRGLELVFNRFVARLSDVLIVHGPSAKRELPGIHGLKDDSGITVIPQGNYISAYKNEITKEQARKILNIGLSEKVFLFFGNLRKYKGVFELVRVFKKIRSPSLRLLISGRPYYESVEKDFLNETRGDSRIFPVLGFIPDDEVQVYMNASDIVVLPYLKITTSAALLLALSFGKPVIAPSLGYIRDVMDPRGGFIYDSNDPEGLFLAMKKAIESDLSSMGGFNLARAREYSWKNSAKKTFEVYSKLIK